MPKLVLTPEIEEAILADVAEGIPLAESCRKHDVGRSTIYDKRDSDKEFAGRLARARELGEDAIAEETLEIADDGSNDWIKRQREDGSVDEVLNHEHVQRSKLRIETRLKLLAVWNPKRFGSKVDVTSGGEKIVLAEALAARRAQVAEGRGGDEA